MWFGRILRVVINVVLASVILLTARAAGTPAAASGPYLFALMVDMTNWMPGIPSPCAVEVVDTASMTRLRTLQIGDRSVISLSVSPDMTHLYVTDQAAGGVAVLDARTGAQIALIPISSPRDCVLSANSAALYVGASNSIAAVDTSTNAVVRTYSTGTDQPLGIALSPDGSLLAAACLSSALYILNASDLSLRARIPITGPSTYPYPNDAVFTDTGRVLLWDSNNDDLYQVDTTSNSQIAAATIDFPTDWASSYNYTNMLSYCPLTGKAYALKETDQLACMDVEAAVGSLTGGFTGAPLVPALTPDGRGLFISVRHIATGPDTLDRYDTLADTFTSNVYTFSQPNMWVLDMHVVNGVDPEALGSFLFSLMVDQLYMTPEPRKATAVEVTDMATMKRTRILQTGNRLATSLAVSPDTCRLYIVDRSAGGVAVLDSYDATEIGFIPVADARDCVLSHDGAFLYVTGSSGIAAVDTSSNTVVGSLPTGSDEPMGIALSPDGNVIGAACGYPSSALYLVRCSDFGLIARIPISNPSGYASPSDVSFTDTGRVLLWDGGNDALYQVDLVMLAQIPTGTIQLPEDYGAFYNFNNMLFYSPFSARAYSLKESLEFAVMDPGSVSYSLFGGFSGVPFCQAMTRDGRSLFVSVTPDPISYNTLDRFDVAGSSFTRGVYTFSDQAMVVRDMRIVQTPVNARIDQIKRLPDRSLVSISGKVATAARDDFGLFLYVEEPDRSSGICVSTWGQSLAGLVRDKSIVTVTGMMGTMDSGERVITSSYVGITSTRTYPLKPVGMPNRAVGGGDFGLPPYYQLGPTDGQGLNNVGLLVRVWGEVVDVDPNDEWVDIDDGSGTRVKVLIADRIAPPPLQTFMSVTGISSIVQMTPPVKSRLILPRDSSDIQLLP